MSLSTLPKWLKLGLPIFLGVLVVGAILAFSTNPELFQGSLRDLNPNQNENDCQLLKQYADDGRLTAMLNGDLSSAQYCADNFPDIWYDQKNSEIDCHLLKQYSDDGSLTAMLNGDISSAQYCADNFPDIWSKQPVIEPIPMLPKEPGPVSPPSDISEECKLLKEYVAEGTLTANVGLNYAPFMDCINNHSEYMHDWPSVAECEALKQHLNNGLLSQMVGDGQVSIIDNKYCAYQYTNMWYGFTPSPQDCAYLKILEVQGLLSQFIADGILSGYDHGKCAETDSLMWNTNNPSAEECEIYSEYYFYGTLTSEMNGNLDRASQCWYLHPNSWVVIPTLSECITFKANGQGSTLEDLACMFYYPTMWNGQNPNEDYCYILKAYMNDGILTAMMNGDITDATYCADNFQDIWGEQEDNEPPPTSEYCQNFVDVPHWHQYYDAVQYLVDAGIVYQHPTGCEFRVNDNLNRAEASKLMVIGFNLVNPAVSAPHFPDVPVDSWYYDYVSTVFENHVMTGSPDGLFKPANTLNRAEMVKMVTVAHHGGNTLSVPAITQQEAQSACPGLSQEELGGWYMPYFANAKDIGIVPVNDPCRPADPATRGEVSQIFYFESLT